MSFSSRYLPHEIIGSGGMGIVYRATDRLTGDTVALKQVNLSGNLHVNDSLASGATEDELRLALAHEFQILAGLRHPHIISVLDYGFDEARQPFFTMTYLPESQNILVAAQDAPFERKIELIQQLLQALAYLHRRGLLHRDLKPDNVLIADSVVRVLDFGLSTSDKIKGSDSIGTPLYLAPELLEGASYSQMADLYAVGVILCQLLTGKHPFEPFDHKFLDRVLEDDPNLAGVEGRIRPFTLRLLAKNPAHRYASANAALVALAEALGQPLPEETQAIRESYLQAAKFVGREAEMDQLVTALEKAQEGECAVWLIGGESGVGKSRLLDELRTIALVNGWQVWRGQTTETSGLPYQLWRHIVPYLLLNTELTTIELSILKEIAPQIDRLFKQTIPTMPSSNGVIDQERLAYTLVEVIRRQTQPTLLLLEDIHWARESLNPIKQILNIIQQMPHVMLVATYRSDDQPTFPTKLPEANLLMLDRLSDTEVRQLSQAMLGEQANTPEIVSLLTHETEGNTYFIIEIMRALAEEAGQLEEIGQMNLPTGILTSSMENLLQRRIQKIPNNDQHLLQLAAVAGRQLDPALLALLKPSEEMTAWLQRGLDTAVLLVRDDQWLFSHDKLRESIINSLSPATRQQLHRQVALGIEELYPDDQSYHQILLEHWHQAGDLDKEIDYLEPVARYLIQAVADHTKAGDLLARGLGMLPKSDPRRIALLNWLTYALIEQLDTQTLEKAEQFAQEARTIAEQTNDLSGLAGSLHHLGKIAFEQDSSDKQADVYIQRSLDCSRSIGAHQQTSSSLILLGEMALHRGNLDEAISYHREALAIIESFGSYYDLGYSLDQLGQVYIVQGEYEKATGYLERSYEALQAGGYKQRLGWTLLNLANLPLLSGDAAGAYERLNHCLAVFHKYGIQTGVAYSLNNLGRTATLTGEYQAARDYLLRSIEIFEKAGTIRGVGYNLLQLGLLYSIQEAFEQAEQALQKSLAGFQEVEDMRFVAYSLARLGIVYLFLKPDQAQDTLYQALTLAHTLEIEPCILEIIFGYALLYLQEGHPLRAAELAGVAQYHPKSNKEIQLWLKLVAPKLSEALAANDLAQAIEKGKSHELAVVVQGLLAREQRISEHALPSFAGLDTLSINGRYQLTQKLGEGGMGIVYRATDRLTGETVALKQVHLSDKLQLHDSLAPGATEDDLRLALAHEFQILAGLRHPHIISVLDYGFDAAKRPYFTMTYLPESQNILEAAKDQPFDRKIELIQQMLQPLAYLHRRGVLHRDLKPDNVLVADGTVRLLDFGLSASDKLGSNSIGTPLYMAPELFEGASYSQPADLYAAGVVLYQLLTGKHPFEPFDHKFVDRMLEEEPDLENVDRRIRPFLTQLLAKTTGKRFATAPDALKALAEALDQPTPPETAAIRESYLQAAKFVGREAEMAQLTEALENAQNGKGSAWLIGGESGVGKTRLLQELRTQALVDGFLVLHGQAIQEGGGLPYQLWRDLLRYAVVAAPEVDALTASVLLPLVPDIGQLLGQEVTSAPELSSQAAQLRLFTTMAQLLQQIDQPILLMLEDLHWSSESLLPIPYLTQQIGQQTILLVGSYRNDERPNLPDALPTMKQMSLGRLTADMMSELSLAMLGEVGQQPEVIDLLQRETEGNAFFAVEVVRALADQVGRLDDVGQMALPETLLPNGIQDVVQRRLARLPESAKDLLVLTAVAGRELELSLVKALASGMDVENWWLPLCAEAAVLDVQQGNWQFSHGKIRDGLLASLDAPQLATYHQQVATAIESHYPDVPEQAARLAYHWHWAGNREKERAYAYLAGQHAASQFSNEDAITFFTQALSQTPADQAEKRYEILLAREAVYDVSAADRAKQQEDLTQLAEIAAELDDLAKQAYVGLRQAQLLGRVAKFEEAIAAAQLVIQQGEVLGEESLVIEAHAEWGHAARARGEQDVSKEHLEYSVARYRERGDLQELGYVLNSLGILYSDMGQMDAERVVLEESLAIAQEINDVRLISRIYNNLSIHFSMKGDYLIAQQHIKNGLQLYKEIGDLLGEGIAYVNMGLDLYQIGDYQMAFTNLTNSATIFRQVNDPEGEDLAYFFLALVAEKRSEYRQTVKSIVEEALATARALNLTKSESDRLGSLGFVFQQEKVYEQAQILFEEAITKADLELHKGFVSTVRFYQARAAHEQQQWDVANQYYLNVLELIEEESHTPLPVPTQCGLAAVYLAQGDVAGALAQVEPAVSPLLNEPLTDGWHDMRAAGQCFHVLKAVDDARADEVLKRAYEVLQKRVSYIEDGVARRFSLEQVPEHVEIVRLYEALEASERETAVSPSPLLAIFGTINGRYQLHTKLGEGGMGIVYRATDRLMGETVALKQVHLSENLQVHDSLAPSATEDDLRLALAHEFQILAGLRHPHIISVLDYGFDEAKRPYFTMTYLPESQNIQVAAQNAPFERKIELIQQLLQALVYLHRRGVLHRDLKPDNVLVSNGAVRVLDFGLSANDKLGNDSVGTPLYMAPELFDGQKYTQSADLYATGVILYQMLTGKHPFAPFDHAFLDRLFDEDPSWDGIDSSLQLVLARLLAKEPVDRPKSATAVLVEIAEALGQPTPTEDDTIRESYLQAATFVGRNKEMAQLHAALHQAQTGQGSAWLIGGESGVGKSRLLRELRTQALVNGFIAIGGQARQEGGGVPFQLWQEPLRHILVSVPEVTDLTASVLLPLIPDIGQLLDRTVHPAPELSSQAAQLRLFTTIANLLQQAQRPILLILEDLHWARESLLPLPYLIQQINQHSLLVVGSYRDDEQRNLPDKLPKMRLLSLPRLTSQMMTELSFAMLGETGRQAEIVDLLQRETEGNAFFAVEVVRALAEAVGRLDDVGSMPLPETLLPNGIQDLIERRLARLPDAARELLVLASVVGRELELPLAKEMASGLDVENWWLPLCADAAILEVHQGTWQFSHAKIQDGLLARLAAHEVAAKHKQVATAIEVLYPDALEQAARLAYHWRKAGNDEKERSYAFRAGRYAASQFANQEAIAFFSQALEKTPQSNLEERYEMLLARETSYARSAADRTKHEEDIIELTNLANRLDDSAKRATVALQEAALCAQTARFEEQMILAKRAVQYAELAGDERLVLNAHRRWGIAASQLHKYEVAQEHLEYSVKRHRELGNLPDLVYALNSLGIIYLHQQEYSASLQCHREALQIGEQVDDLALVTKLVINMTPTFLTLGDYLQSQAYAEKGLQLYKEIGDLNGQGYAYINKGVNGYLFGDYQSAFADFKESATIFRQTNDRDREAFALFRLSQVAERLGNSEEAKAMIEESLANSKELGTTGDRGRHLALIGFLYKQQPQFEVAEQRFEEALSMLDASKHVDTITQIRFHQARMAHEEQRWADAQARYLEMLALLEVRDNPNVRLHSPAHSGLAAVFLAQGDVSRALAQAEPAIEHMLHQPLKDGWNDMRVAVQCYHILNAARDERASNLLQRAYDELQKRAQFIQDQASKRYALEEVPEHWEIIQLYEANRE